MDAALDQLKSLQESLDAHNGFEGSSCPTCGLTPFELARQLQDIVDREVEKRLKKEKEVA
jgi:4-hydroxy-3-methylbut-2-en-1-yl diphosphate synthase IspG/GcpE